MNVGEDMNHYVLFCLLQGSDYCISHEDFLHTVLPSLNNQDTVLLIYSHSGKNTQISQSAGDSKYSTCLLSVFPDNLSDVAKMAKTVREKTSKLHAVYHHTEGCRAAEQVSQFTCQSVCVTG